MDTDPIEDLFTILGIPDSDEPPKGQPVRPVPSGSGKGTKKAAAKGGATATRPKAASPGSQPTPPSPPRPVGGNNELPSLHLALESKYSRRLSPQRTQTYRPVSIYRRKLVKPVPHVCEITAAVPIEENGTFLLELVNTPRNDQFRELVEEKNSRWSKENGNSVLRIALTYRDHPRLHDLADAVLKVVSWRHVKKTKKRYPVPAWKHVAQEIAEALHELARTVQQYRAAVTAARKGK